MWLIVDILLPFIAILSTVFIAVYKIRGERKTSLLLKEENLSLKEEVKDFSEPLMMDLEMFNSIKNAVQRIFDATKADRFLILTAYNGKTYLKFATAVYEQHKHNDKIQLSIGAVGKYIRFEFDDVYRNMLKTIENKGYTTLDVEFMPEGDLKSLYQGENVNHSLIYFLDRIPIDGERDRLFYCSIATHDYEPYTGEEIIVVKSSIDAIKQELSISNT